MTHIKRINEMVSNKVYLYEWANELWISSKPLKNNRVNGSTTFKLVDTFDDIHDAYLCADEMQEILGTNTNLSNKLADQYAKEIGYAKDEMNDFYNNFSVFDEDTMEII